MLVPESCKVSVELARIIDRLHEQLACEFPGSATYTIKVGDRVIAAGGRVSRERPIIRSGKN